MRKPSHIVISCVYLISIISINHFWIIFFLFFWCSVLCLTAALLLSASVEFYIGLYVRVCKEKEKNRIKINFPLSHMFEIIKLIIESWLCANSFEQRRNEADSFSRFFQFSSTSIWLWGELWIGVNFVPKYRFISSVE